MNAYEQNSSTARLFFQVIYFDVNIEKGYRGDGRGEFWVTNATVLQHPEKSVAKKRCGMHARKFSCNT